MDCQTHFVDLRGGDAGKNNSTDMLSKLSTGPPLQVKSCVTKNRRLSPVVLNIVDVAALLKSVIEFKTELIKFQGNRQ